MRGTQNLVLGSPVRGNRSKENVLASKTPLSSRLSNLCAIYHPGRSEASVVGGISMSTIESHCFYPSGKGVSLKPFHTRCCYDKYINPLVTVHRVKCKGGCYMGGGGTSVGAYHLELPCARFYIPEPDFHVPHHEAMSWAYVEIGKGLCFRV